jgi:exopolysaccharide biosynthesis polyprenyl glycosylphosphotransferase
MNAPVARVSGSLRKRAKARAKALRMPMMPSLERRRLQCYLSLMVGDIAALFIGFAMAGVAYATSSGLYDELLIAQLLLPVYLTVAIYNDTYSLGSLRSSRLGMQRGMMALGLSVAIVTFITFYTKSSAQFSRAGFTLGVVFVALNMLAVRLMMRRVVRWRCGATVINELVIDDGGPAISLPRAFHVSAQSFGLVPSLSDPYAMDRIGMMLRNADRVVVSSAPERRAQWAIILKGANVSGEVIDDSVSELAAQGARSVGGRGLLQVSIGPLGMRSRLLKRLFDLAAAGSALLALSPLLLAVALAIKLDDRGPVFFVQRRVGRGNRFFPIFKFRSMSVNKVGRDGTQSAAKNDQRITRIGRLIRSTSIDELPQLLNVLRGDMSLVGPRPHAIGSQAGDKLFWEVDARYWERHALKPGLTGLAQIRGLRGATDCEEDLAGRLNADLEYLNGWSLWRDLWIIMSTFKVLVHDRAF